MPNKSQTFITIKLPVQFVSTKHLSSLVDVIWGPPKYTPTEGLDHKCTSFEQLQRKHHEGGETPTRNMVGYAMFIHTCRLDDTSLSLMATKSQPHLETHMQH